MITAEQETPQRRSGAPRERRTALLVASGAVYLPMALAVPVGLALGGEVGTPASAPFGAILLHNALVSVLAVAVGLTTFGVLTVAFTAVGWVINGYAMGVVLAERGVAELVTGLTHFLPETVSSVLTAAAGVLIGVRQVLRALDVPVRPWRRCLVDVVLLMSAGLVLLLPAAALEAVVVPR